jgi:hypothetical protein
MVNFPDTNSLHFSQPIPQLQSDCATYGRVGYDVTECDLCGFLLKNDKENKLYQAAGDGEKVLMVRIHLILFQKGNFSSFNNPSLTNFSLTA